mmetsp:Transcript_48554/g.77668  ORF Transcript_48554/g.77668 Transcript_48554/m.77668 type:complete len:291 (+) Transcript_48554:127-999(+)|eukprot:CAMPEP_0197070032 /NCGR_PEP_ID=MMETSP1384-20130603/197222_1 /TAXON_ID=29189 /ORGANISM="Ammonia sp." /LENGTH=290 /DNA_ID=CAMNT_0042508281 /DNA_START=83 /DNA_END=955 /DNA_ORIENTATION=-
MADDEKANGSLSEAFRYTVGCTEVNGIDVNSGSSPCMTLNFTHKKSRQIYHTTLSVADCKELIEKVPMMPISGLLKLLSDALSEWHKSERLAVSWTLSENEAVLNIDVIRKSADEYVPDMVFALKLSAKSMDPVDKLLIRIEELEQTIETLQKEAAQKNELVRNAAYSNADTGLLTAGGQREVLQLELPQKAGKFVVRYSAEICAVSGTSWWIYYGLTLGGNLLAPKGGGQYLPANASQAYPFPVSQSVVVTLNGNENAQQRKLALYVRPDQTYQAGMRNTCIEYYEIPM